MSTDHRKTITCPRCGASVPLRQFIPLPRTPVIDFGEVEGTVEIDAMAECECGASIGARGLRAGFNLSRRRDVLEHVESSCCWPSADAGDFHLVALEDDPNGDFAVNGTLDLSCDCGALQEREVMVEIERPFELKVLERAW